MKKSKIYDSGVFMFWDNFYSACLKKGTKPNPLAKELHIASGSMTAWKGGKLPNGETLLKIANYLDVSVDYLLDRTEEPKSIVISGNTQNNINGNNNIKIAEHEQEEVDTTTQQLVEAFQNLGFFEKAKVMNLVAELSNK